MRLYTKALLLQQETSSHLTLIKEHAWHFCAIADCPAAAVPVSCGKQETEKAAHSEMTFSVLIVNINFGGKRRGDTRVPLILPSKQVLPRH
jgi:hypothetical protein